MKNFLILFLSLVGLAASSSTTHADGAVMGNLNPVPALVILGVVGVAVITIPLIRGKGESENSADLKLSPSHSGAFAKIEFRF